MPRPLARKPIARSVYIDAELWAWVQSRAGKLGVTSSEIVRRSLTASVERNRKDEDAAVS